MLQQTLRDSYASSKCSEARFKARIRARQSPKMEYPQVCPDPLSDIAIHGKDIQRLAVFVRTDFADQASNSFVRVDHRKRHILGTEIGDDLIDIPIPTGVNHQFEMLSVYS